MSGLKPLRNYAKMNVSMNVSCVIISITVMLPLNLSLV